MINKPCPFCGRIIQKLSDHSSGCYFKAINSCHATPDDIAKAWNKRKENNMEIIYVESKADITPAEIVQLESQNVVVEDWDYMLFFPVEKCYEQEQDVEHFDAQKDCYFYKTELVLRPSWRMQAIIDNGGEVGDWYENIEFRNRKWILGIKRY